MGIKSPALAVFPAWAGDDSSRVRLVVISSQSQFVGPVVQTFKYVDSTDGAIQVRSSGPTTKGTLAPKFDALIQELIYKLRDHLTDSAQGRFLAQGTAIRKTDASNLGVDSMATEYWEVRLDGLPSRGKVFGFLALGLAAILIGIALHLVVKKSETRQAEEEEEERSNEKPLV